MCFLQTHGTALISSSAGTHILLSFYLRSEGKLSGDLFEYSAHSLTCVKLLIGTTPVLQKMDIFLMLASMKSSSVKDTTAPIQRVEITRYNLRVSTSCIRNQHT